MATATAMAAPAMVTAATRARDSTASLARLIPRARRIGNSAASRISCRLRSWPMVVSAMSASKAAKAPSAMASGRMARWVVVNSSDRLTMLKAPAGTWSRLASAAAAARKLAVLAPGRNRRPVWIPSEDSLARRVLVNGEPSSAIGSLLVLVAGTIWLSNATTAETRNASETARCGSGLPVAGLSGITSRCSVPPGRRCSRPASCWSIMAWPAALGLNIRP